MGEKAIKKYNHVVVLTPMVYAFNLSGCRLLTFAYIHGFCRDESSCCYASLTHISETIGYARRTVAEAINALLKDGYIYKIGTTTIEGQKVNGYRTYFFELMDRYDSGEDIKPALLKTRRARKKIGSAQSAPPDRTTQGSAQNSEDVVHIVPKGSAQSAPNNTMIMLFNNLSAGARAQEEREFYKIFFLNNAADPAAEVAKFIAFYTSRGWVDAQGREYDTPAKRTGLAYGWDCKSGKRLPETQDTKRFLAFIGDIYAKAQELGGINPMQMLDVASSYRIDEEYPGLIWKCRQSVRDWIESHRDVSGSILRSHYGPSAGLYFADMREI